MALQRERVTGNGQRRQPQGCRPLAASAIGNGTIPLLESIGIPPGVGWKLLGRVRSKEGLSRWYVTIGVNPSSCAARPNTFPGTAFLSYPFSTLRVWRM